MSHVVNDIHSLSNEAVVAEIVATDSTESVQQAIRRAADEGRPVAIAGGR